MLPNVDLSNEWRRTDDGALRQVGPYRLCLELAAGGMGTVHLGHGRTGGAGHFAAVKIIHPQLAEDRNFIQMFMDEAEIAARIHHPNVCQVLDYDLRQGQLYLAMEYLAGETMMSLFRTLKRRVDPPTYVAHRVARALADACEGLHAAHELTDADGELLQVVHRDVTPGNIILTLDGVAKVLDFGVAAAAGKRHRTRAGTFKGKLAYAPPETLRGELVDRRADVWSVGIVAWELLTGERLFRRDNDLDTLHAITESEIPAPSEVRAGLPPELDAIVMRALERDRERRFDTTRELGRALMRVAVSHEPLSSADLAEWMDSLYPGIRQRSDQLLGVAAQIAGAEVEPSATPRSAASPVKTPSRPPAANESAPTVLVPAPPPLPREVSETHTTPAPPPRRLRWTAAAGAVGLVLGAGVSYAWMLPREGAAPAPPPRAAIGATHEERPAASATGLGRLPVELSAEPEMRITRGDYVVELVESPSDDLVLRVRARGERITTQAPATSEPETERAEPPPRRRARSRGSERSEDETPDSRATGAEGSAEGSGATDTRSEGARDREARREAREAREAREREAREAGAADGLGAPRRAE